MKVTKGLMLLGALVLALSVNALVSSRSTLVRDSNAAGYQYREPHKEGHGLGDHRVNGHHDRATVDAQAAEAKATVGANRHTGSYMYDYGYRGQR